jgi:type I restriction enzyme S subunit
MKYAAYSEYKPAPMAWVDQVPRHWNAATLRWLSSRYAGGTPDKGIDAYWEDGTIPWLNSGAVNDGYITAPSELITPEGFANSSAKWIPNGALVMALAGQGKTKGLVAQLGISTTCNQSMAAIIPARRIDPRYLFWWLTANYQNIRNLAGGEARDGLNLDLLGSIPCPLPPLEEQQTIAHFLDAKTAQIDALVAKKRHLIKKLKEKRQALIARTVTRGLPPEAAKAAGLEPNPRFVPSGVAWFDEVPIHWQVVPYKRLCSRVDVGIAEAATHAYCDDGVPIIRSTNVRPSGIETTDLLHIEPWFAAKNRSKTLRSGDLVTVRTGYPGTTAIVPPQLDGCQCFTLVQSSLRGRVHGPYVTHFINSVGMRYFEVEGWGSAQSNISVPIVQSLPIAVLPFDEQLEIAKYLDIATSEIDRLTQKAERAMNSLTEYRQALITSAVTGKIDVRSLTPELSSGGPRHAPAALS